MNYLPGKCSFLFLLELPLSRLTHFIVFNLPPGALPKRLTNFVSKRQPLAVAYLRQHLEGGVATSSSRTYSLGKKLTGGSVS